MKNEHITDNEIQQFLFADSVLDQKIIEHVQSCNDCKLRVDQYKTIFEAVRGLEKPAFDFNLAETVIKSIPIKRPQYSIGKILIAICITGIIFISGLTAYFLKIDLGALISGMAPISAYLILTTLVSFLLFQFIDINRQYKKQIDLVNSY
jgi:hypothetical protein